MEKAAVHRGNRGDSVASRVDDLPAFPFNLHNT